MERNPIVAPLWEISCLLKHSETWISNLTWHSQHATRKAFSITQIQSSASRRRWRIWAVKIAVTSVNRTSSWLTRSVTILCSAKLISLSLNKPTSSRCLPNSMLLIRSHHLTRCQERNLLSRVSSIVIGADADAIQRKSLKPLFKLFRHLLAPKMQPWRSRLLSHVMEMKRLAS